VCARAFEHEFTFVGAYVTCRVYISVCAHVYVCVCVRESVRVYSDVLFSTYSSVALWLELRTLKLRTPNARDKSLFALCLLEGFLWKNT